MLSPPHGDIWPRKSCLFGCRNGCWAKSECVVIETASVLPRGEKRTTVILLMRSPGFAKDVFQHREFKSCIPLPPSISPASSALTPHHRGSFPIRGPEAIAQHYSCDRTSKTLCVFFLNKFTLILRDFGIKLIAQVSCCFQISSFLGHSGTCHFPISTQENQCAF